MDKYLYRMSMKRTDAWSSKTPKPLYFVAESKNAAEKWADENLITGLSVAKVTRLARQIGPHVFTAV